MADFRRLEEYALQLGAYRAKVISTEQIVIDARVQIKCQIPRCESYGKCFVCPPNTLTVQEFAALTDRYDQAILIQVRVEKEDLSANKEQDMADTVREAMNNWTTADIIQTEKKLHEIVNKVESEAMSMGAYLAAGFKASHCRLCDECAGINSSSGCKHPYLARPSVEGVGVDVQATAKKAGLAFELFSNDYIVYSGLVLLD